MIYFAYGSNMLRERLVERVGAVGEIGRTFLPGYQLTFHKRGTDGSGKCTVIETPEGPGVWGVAFALDVCQKTVLDDFEGVGYRVADVGLWHGDDAIGAFTYIAHDAWLDPSLTPFSWYRRLVLAGAEQARLPEHHVEWISAVSAVDDTDRERVRAHQALLQRP